ncbi:MAG: ATP-binding cassette domain-containing protein [Proteobacteria bacterium]|jgi:multiple sugar transport system ATP-binding protein|nr:ATP-binding cassette domain-containing protein [Pseudomonadota bacterium]
MANVEFVGLQKRYGSTVVLKGVTLEIFSGEYVVLVGPSGCGKSTLLRCIAGLEEISAGELRIKGRVVNKLSPRDRNVAMVFQSYALYPHMTVRGNMSFALKVARATREKIVEEVEQAAKMLDLSGLLDRYPGQLSGGQRQRVAMGRAIVRRPDVFLFDEPLSNLDASLRTHMRAELKRLHRQIGTTTVHVTHDQVEALTLADRIIILHEGIVQQVGTPREVFDKPVNTFVATFIGSPSMNLLKDPDDGHTLGVRPTDMRLGEGPHRGVVDLVESMGAEALVHLDFAGNKVVAQVPEPVAVSSGEEVAFAFGKTHHFHAETGLRL